LTSDIVTDGSLHFKSDDSLFFGDDNDDDTSQALSKDAKACTTEHLGITRQYWRDIILGVNDGLVSTFLLVAGVAGGKLESTEILLTAIAGAIAGAVSMCAGEYVATKSQNEVMTGEIALEKKHIREYNRDELKELKSLLEVIGIQDKRLQRRLMCHYQNDPQDLLKIMVALELGVLKGEERSPIWAGIFSCLLFLIGASPSVFPFAIPDIDPVIGLIIAALATSIGLLIVGIGKTYATRGNCISAAIENLTIAGLGGGLAYLVGMIFDKVVNS
jgi:VIT1/CCC1 family predicted Fe2+/Mn2+ transporter